MWIEMRMRLAEYQITPVILRARMWIEMSSIAMVNCRLDVILRARMWIEMTDANKARKAAEGHPPCEDVD